MAQPVPEMLELARSIAGQAEPGEQIEAFVGWSRDTHVRVYQGEVESLSCAEPAGVGVRVVKGGRVGFAYVGSLSQSAAVEAVGGARDNCGFASEDAHAGLAVPDGLPPQELDLFRESLEEATTERKVELALDVDREARSRDPRVRQVTSSDYRDHMASFAIATSTGIEAEGRRGFCVLYTSVLAGAGDDTQTGSGHSAGRTLADLDVERPARDAIERATRTLGAKKARTTRLPVVLDPRVSSTLLSMLAATLSGDEVAKGRSLFAGRIGEEVASSTFTMFDDPTDAGSFGASAFDGEGLPCRANRLIEAGKLLGYLYDTHSGRVAGVSSTASAVRGGYKTTPSVGARAVSVEPGELSFWEIVRKVGDGLYVQSVTGTNTGVNTVSGDLSLGAVGLMIRDGELAEPVREITIGSTLQRMLQRVLMVGSDLEWLPGSATGVTIAIDDMSVSGD